MYSPKEVKDIVDSYVSAIKDIDLHKEIKGMSDKEYNQLQIMITDELLRMLVNAIIK